MVNTVENRISISGTVNAIRNNKIGGNLYFLSPKGMVVGSTGVINAGSLTMITGSPISRGLLAASMLDCLYRMNTILISGREEILTRYRRDCVTLGQEVCLVRGEEVRHGLALDIDPSGALLVRLPDGQVEAVNSGEVSVRGMYGYI